MKTSLKSIIALGAIAAAGNAGAAIVLPSTDSLNTGGSELVFNIYDKDGNTKGFTQDLGVSFAGFNPNLTQVFNLNASVATALAGVPTASLYWNVVAADSVRDTSAPPAQAGARILITSIDDSPTLSPNAAVNGIATTSNINFAAMNTFSTHNSLTNGYHASVGTDGSAYAGTTGVQQTGNGINSEGTLTDTLAFYALQEFKDGFLDPDGDAIENLLAGTWSLNLSALTLSYIVEGGGPQVPLPAGIWLLGSGLLGMAGIARRRRAAAAAAA